ncbi:MAG TPA: PhzF family phenazine biosynthesis protein [Solirubrobacteraceae bacterium]|jgi:trans-2,3-dihydro-3-hydroxyanthranilate isomerase|nr:PhzF family phenazine biosynthesis protein [Solirubrobacteraceae bacterium]
MTDSAPDFEQLGRAELLAAPPARAGQTSRRYVLVDVFTQTPLEGNAVAVFTDARGLSSQVMQRVARELNLSETVFVLPGSAGATARARIFTPAQELPFAGHPVLGCAAVIAAALGLRSVSLQTGVGNIALEMQREEVRVLRGEMEQRVAAPRPYAQAQQLFEALGVDAPALPVECYENGPLHVMVALSSEEAVAALAPDIRALGALDGVAVSCFAGDARRYKTRVFAPGAGVAEDPATGSAAGALAVHLGRHGRVPFGRCIEIHQGKEIARPSTLYAQADADADAGDVRRVRVGGCSVIVGEGTLLLP